MRRRLYHLWLRAFPLLFAFAACTGDDCCGGCEDEEDDEEEGCGGETGGESQGCDDGCDLPPETDPDAREYSDAAVDSYRVRVTIIGWGRVRSAELGIDCDAGETCSDEVAPGTEVRLTPTSYLGAGAAVFTGLPGGSTVFDVWDDVEIVATFGGLGRWPRRYGGAGDDEPVAVVADAQGNLFVTGTFDDDLDIGPFTLQPVGGRDVYAAALDPQGDVLWARSYGSAADDSASGIALAPGGRVAVGRSNGDVAIVLIDITGGEDVDQIDLAGVGRLDDVAVAADGALFAAGADAGGLWLASFDAAGDPRFSRAYPGPTAAASIALAGADVVLASGSSVTRIADGGDPIWSQPLGGGAEVATDVAVATDGRIGVLGDSAGDVFLVELAGDGSSIWSDTFGGPAEDAAGGLADDGAGGWYLGLSFADELVVGTDTYPSAGQQDLGWLHVDALHLVDRVDVHGGAGADRMIDLTVDPEAVVMLGASDGPFYPSVAPPPAGGIDTVVARTPR
jgi:hypothetical protein